MKKITLIFLALAVVINSFSVANVQSEAAENDIENEVHTEILEQSGNEWNNQENQKNSSDFSDSDTIQDNSDINATENGVDAEKQDDTKVEDPQNMDVQLSLDMKVRYTVANNMVEETVGQAAIERGPLVYCCESADTHASTLDDIYLDLNAEFVPVEFEIEGRKMTALETEEYSIDRSEFDRNALYQPLKYHGMSKKHVRLIPYYAWDNRDYGEMRIWFPVAYAV